MGMPVNSEPVKGVEAMDVVRGKMKRRGLQERDFKTLTLGHQD